MIEKIQPQNSAYKIRKLILKGTDPQIPEGKKKSFKKTNLIKP